jgi:hypothetical protein
MSHTITQLSGEQKNRLLGVLGVGCDRQTAAHIVGCTVEDFGRTLESDPAFAVDVRRTEAAVELAHMRAIYKAVIDDKQWRASIWWLEQHAPERFVSRGPGTVTQSHLRAFVDLLSEHLNSDIHDPADRERVLDRLKQMYDVAAHINDILWDIGKSRSDVRVDEAGSVRLAPASLLARDVGEAQGGGRPWTV